MSSQRKEVRLTKVLAKSIAQELREAYGLPDIKAKHVIAFDNMADTVTCRFAKRSVEHIAEEVGPMFAMGLVESWSMHACIMHGSSRVVTCMELTAAGHYVADNLYGNGHFPPNDVSFDVPNRMQLERDGYIEQL